MVIRRKKLFLLILPILSVGFALANLDYIREHRARAFTSAAWEGELWKMRRLHLLGADVNAYAPGNGPAIIAAAWRGQTDSISYLLDRGAEINQKDKYGYTPLIAAADQRYKETVRHLLSRGADANLVGEEGSAEKSNRRESFGDSGDIERERSEGLLWVPVQ
jgi:hypothetical protein